MKAAAILLSRADLEAQRFIGAIRSVVTAYAASKVKSGAGTSEALSQYTAAGKAEIAPPHWRAVIIHLMFWGVMEAMFL